MMNTVKLDSLLVWLPLIKETNKMMSEPKNYKNVKSEEKKNS
jgi:hypothetical protein